MLVPQGLQRPPPQTSRMSYNLLMSLGGMGVLWVAFFWGGGGNNTSCRPLDILHIEIKKEKPRCVTAPSDGGC